MVAERERVSVFHEWKMILEFHAFVQVSDVMEGYDTNQECNTDCATESKAICSKS